MYNLHYNYFFVLEVLFVYSFVQKTIALSPSAGARQAPLKQLKTAAVNGLILSSGKAFC
jgi:hypothetical protein